MQMKLRLKCIRRYQPFGSNEKIALGSTNPNAKLKSNNLKIPKVNFFFQYDSKENTKKSNLKSWHSAFLLQGTKKIQKRNLNRF